MPGIATLSGGSDIVDESRKTADPIAQRDGLVAVQSANAHRAACRTDLQVGNPVVVGELINEVMTFKFQVPTDSLGFPIYGEAYSGTDPALTIDVFSVAGDHVCTLDETSDSDALFGTYWIEWDLRNSGGKDVSSGVYVAYARLYESSSRNAVLAEEKTKIVVIR